MADVGKLDWWTRLMSGADNQTPAIGRYLGVLLFLNLCLVIPTGIGCALLGGKVTPDVWFGFLRQLETYVPAMVLAVGALIAGTHFTEPKRQAGDSQ